MNLFSFQILRLYCSSTYSTYIRFNRDSHNKTQFSLDFPRVITSMMYIYSIFSSNNIEVNEACIKYFVYIFKKCIKTVSHYISARIKKFATKEPRMMILMGKWLRSNCSVLNYVIILNKCLHYICLYYSHVKSKSKEIWSLWSHRSVCHYLFQNLMPSFTCNGYIWGLNKHLNLIFSNIKSTLQKSILHIQN